MRVRNNVLKTTIDLLLNAAALLDDLDWALLLLLLLISQFDLKGGLT
jgi:hypothetical protein